MKRRNKLTLYLIATLFLMAILIGYRVFLFIHEKDYQALNAENIERCSCRQYQKFHADF